MKRYLFVILALAIHPALGDSRFDGTWIWNTDATELSDKPETYLLDKGVYHCNSCTPSHQVQADGEDYQVKGQPYDKVAVNVVDTNTVKIRATKNNKIYGLRTLRVSDDGQQLINEYEDPECMKSV